MLSQFLKSLSSKEQVSFHFMAAVTIFTVILDPKKIKSVTVSTFLPSICHEVMGLDAMNLSFLNAEFQANFFTLLFYFHQDSSQFHHKISSQFLFTFCHKGGVICISEVIDISPSNLDSSLCFIQPIISHDVLCI